MSDDAQDERTRLATEAAQDIERVEAVIRGDVAELEQDDSPIANEAEAAEQWAQWGRLLRQNDPASYRILSRLALTVAALAVAPVEN